ncbi:hypothetical protein HK405_002388, partial [Cladochytrium tenue]
LAIPGHQAHRDDLRRAAIAPNPGLDPHHRHGPAQVRRRPAYELPADLQLVPRRSGPVLCVQR